MYVHVGSEFSAKISVLHELMLLGKTLHCNAQTFTRIHVRLRLKNFKIFYRVRSNMNVLRLAWNNTKIYDDLSCLVYCRRRSNEVQNERKRPSTSMKDDVRK